MRLPYKIHIAGHSKILRCIGLHSSCGDIKDGIAFNFDGEGGWVVDRSDLENILHAAKNPQTVSPNPRPAKESR